MKQTTSLTNLSKSTSQKPFTFTYYFRHTHSSYSYEIANKSMLCLFLSQTFIQSANLLQQVNGGLKVKAKVDELPLDSLALVFLLLQDEHGVVEQLLQLLVGVVDAQLLKGVHLKVRYPSISHTSWLIAHETVKARAEGRGGGGGGGGEVKGREGDGDGGWRGKEKISSVHEASHLTSYISCCSKSILLTRRPNTQLILIGHKYRTSLQSSPLHNQPSRTFDSHLPYIINHHKHLSCFMQLYNPMTAQLLDFL